MANGDPSKYYEGEEEALLELSTLDDPMARVIYHMSVRQLDMAQQAAVDREVVRRLVIALDKQKGASQEPPLREVVYKP